MVLTCLGALGLAVGCGTAQPSPSTEQPTINPVGLVDLFVAATQAADRSFHLEWTGQRDVDAERESFSGALDFKGDDHAGTVILSNNQLSQAVTQIAYVDGIAYANSAILGTSMFSGWENLGALDAFGSSLDPLAGLSKTTVAYQGQTAVNGSSVAHLIGIRIDAASWPRFLGGIGDHRVDRLRSQLDLYVDVAGRPLSATMVVLGVIEGSAAAARFTAELRFTNWGEQVKIEAPLTSR